MKQFKEYRRKLDLPIPDMQILRRRLPAGAIPMEPHHVFKKRDRLYYQVQFMHEDGRLESVNRFYEIMNIDDFHLGDLKLYVVEGHGWKLCDWRDYPGIDEECFWIWRPDKNRESTRGNAGERHPNSKLNWRLVRKIRKEYAAGGTSYPKLGRKYGVHHSVIGRVVINELWVE